MQVENLTLLHKIPYYLFAYRSALFGVKLGSIEIASVEGGCKLHSIL